MNARSLLGLVLLSVAAFAPARAADIAQPVMLIAAPQLNDPVYGRSVLLVAPIGEDRHIGFIINRPTGKRLGQLVPEHGPSQKIPGPVFFGGPMDRDMLFAIVERADSPGGISLQLGAELFSSFDAPTVDRIIEAESDHARFYTGLVAWRSGELAQEINRGLWYLAKPDPAVVLRKSTDGLWDEMLARSRKAANTI